MRKRKQLRNSCFVSNIGAHLLWTLAKNAGVSPPLDGDYPGATPQRQLQREPGYSCTDIFVLDKLAEFP
jgi:hypothetical protein